MKKLTDSAKKRSSRKVSKRVNKVSVKSPTAAKKKLGFLEVEIRNKLRDNKVLLTKLAAETANNFAILDERSMLTYRMAYALISFLEETSGLTNEVLEVHLTKVLERWKAEALVEAKKRLVKDQAICEKCFHVDIEDLFFADDIACPKCKGTSIFFYEEETKEEPKETTEEV